MPCEGRPTEAMAIKRTIPRSQAIYPYGVGAILDWGQECFVVLDTRGDAWKRSPKVTLPRLQNRLGAPDGFHLPPVIRDNAPTLELRVQRFPAWLFCPSCRRMWKWTREEEVHGRARVPKCLTRGCGAILVPMRYVAVCEGGHITDVDWYRWAHSDRPSGQAPCSPQAPELYFDAKADKGATLDALALRCGRCGSRQTLKEILNQNSLKRTGQKCWGRQPWQSRASETSCDHPLRVLQRSQTAVHYADIVSALDLTTTEPDGASELDAVMQGKISALGVETLEDAEQYAPQFAKSSSSQLGRTVTVDEVRAWLRRNFDGNKTSTGTETLEQFSEAQILLEEWPALTTPTAQPTKQSPLIVRQDRESVSSFPGLESILPNVYLVERLREVRAFRGFRRVRPDTTLVRPDLGIQPPQKWLPAIEVFGEGIFLQFSIEAVANWEQAQGAALKRRMKNIEQSLGTGEGPVKRFSHLAPLTSRFVMAHTFSHLLMRQLCYESGYGSASVRERLYVFEDKLGILIYTANGDSEGSLGGLVRQGRNDRLGRTIAAALERATWCSNDPICREVPEHGFEKLDLAACHACALVPETSCSHLNALLDRELVIGEGSPGVRGFFTDYLQLAQARVEP